MITMKISLRCRCALYYLLLIGIATRNNHSQAQTCDFSDTTSCRYVADGICDTGEGSSLCSLNTDCWDCDPCHQFDGNCGLCTQNACYFCPSDAQCLSQPIDETTWMSVRDVPRSRMPACLAEGGTEWVGTCESVEDAPYSDPLYKAQQWVFDSMKVQAVWEQGFTGRGVTIRVNDPEGVDATHPELAQNFNKEASCDNYLPPDPSVNLHGTAVASVAVGGGSNGECSVGVAPDATLTACLGPTSFTDESAVASFLNGLSTTHISINSWNFDACSKRMRDDRFLQDDGLCPFSNPTEINPCRECPDFSDPDCEDYIVTFCSQKYEEEYSGCAEFLDLFVACGYNVLSDVGQSAILRGIREGRNGKGIIYVFAAGNEYATYEDINMEGWLNTRFTIAVGGVGKDEKHASYSTSGAALFVSGPGGDRDTFGNHWTALAGGGCYDAQYGTSFSAPAVAGGVALMLEANPNLTWRDIQGIIASTSRVVNNEDPSWVTNGASLQHSNLYGFGIFDATKAVEAAKQWVNYGPEKQSVAVSGVINLPIADDALRLTTSAVSVNFNGSFTVESVAVYLQLQHESRGDLEIVLTSPSGTQSILHPPHRPEKQQLAGDERWKLMTVKNYGEGLNGDWTLTLADNSPGNLGQCVDDPFAYLIDQNDGTFNLVDCEVLEFGGSCFGGEVLRSNVNTLRDENDNLASSACCACGGGSPVSDTNVLVSWRMVVYGHTTLADGTEATSANTFATGVSTSMTGRRLGGAVLCSLVASILAVFALL